MPLDSVPLDSVLLDSVLLDSVRPAKCIEDRGSDGAIKCSPLPRGSVFWHGTQHGHQCAVGILAVGEGVVEGDLQLAAIHVQFH